MPRGAAPLWRTLPRAGAGARMPSSTTTSLGERAPHFRLRLLSNPDYKILARASCHVPTADCFALGGRPSPEHATHMSSTVHNNIVASDRSTTGLLSVSVHAVGSERKVDCKANMAWTTMGCLGIAAVQAFVAAGSFEMFRFKRNCVAQDHFGRSK